MTPEDKAKYDRLVAASEALNDSALEIADRQDLKEAVAGGAALVMSVLSPILAGLAGGSGGPAAAMVVAVVGGAITRELQAQAGAKPAKE